LAEGAVVGNQEAVSFPIEPDEAIECFSLLALDRDPSHRVIFRRMWFAFSCLAESVQRAPGPVKLFQQGLWGRGRISVFVQRHAEA
jgi:hypothetical protein